MEDKIKPDMATTEARADFDGTDQDVYVFPASYAQKRFWFLDQFEPGSPWYNIPTAFRLTGTFDPLIFIDCIHAIVGRHESLRTIFDHEDGEPVQLVYPELKLEIPVIDISTKSGDALEKEILRLATEEARLPFDLAKGPLIRVRIIKAGDRDHVVLLTMHHIISDGWSMGVMINELSRLYAAFTGGNPDPLPELPIQYGDYSEWQKEYLAGDILQKQINFWKKHIGANPPVLELPYDRPRPQVQTNVGSSAGITISKDIANRLTQLSREEGATLFMSLLGIFKILLFRYSGMADISIGTPIANRTRREVEGLIGLFINTLVIRTEFSDNPTFREFLNRIRKSTLDAYENQDVPFEYLVDVLQPNRDMSYPPLFQVMFILQNAPVQIQTMATDLRMQMIDVDMGTSTFDITMSLSEGTDGLRADIEFNTDLFDRTSIERLLDHFQNLIHRVVQNPDQSIAFLPLLSRKEEAKILLDWNDHFTDRERKICIHHLFERRANENPDAIAVVCQDASIAYGALNQKANQLAHYLRKSGVRAETKIGILAEKSVDLIIAMLGVLKAGGAYLPLDPDYPEERLAYMLDDAQVPALITQKKFMRLVSTFPGQVINLDSDRSQFEKEPVTQPISEVNEENLAYLIYTSGSTGKAKGTMVTHSALVNAYLAWEEAYELRTLAHNHLQMASFSFDVFSGDWTRGLCSGGKLVLVPRDLLLEAEQLYNYMRREEVDIAEFVPAVLRNLIQYLEKTGQKLDFFRNLIAGSDIWYVNEYRKFLKFIGPDTRLINSFGLTEATIDSTYFESQSLNLPPERLVPIGIPFNNMTIYILDNYFQPTPIGVRGELYVGGEGLARGYLNRPDLTADRFIPNPFSSRAGERMYKTGDMARYLPDGNIEFLGRADTQVKLRGFRIELGEIESALGKYPEIKDNAVVLREDTPGDKRLVAYYVPQEGKEPTSIQLKEFLGASLPDYMVPSAFVWLDQLPLTPNGKVDRRALPKPDQDVLLRDLEAEYVAPRTSTEEVIAGIFSAILNMEKVGALHNFFDLGGHSLLATQLISRLRDNFSADIPLRSVFETPTVAGLALAVDKAKLSSAVFQPPPILPVSRESEIPLSFAQQRLWFLDQLEPDTPFYNIPETYLIEGPLKIEFLERSINEVIRRHESLRTTFHKENGNPKQVIHPELRIRLKTRDLSDLPEVEKGIESLRIAQEVALIPISITELPLFNLEILRLSDNEHAIILIIHHIISDNWSTQVLMGELSILYDAFSRNEPSPLPELPIQYADFGYWQRNWLQGEILDSQINYWKKQLGGSPPVLELPTDRPRPAIQTFNGSYKSLALDKETTDGLHQLTKDTGATIFMTLLAAFTTLLKRYSGQDDICIGTPIANRNHSEIENLIGFFVNTLVLRTDLSGKPTFRELIGRVREVALGAYAHQDLPFEKIVDALQPDRNMSHSPLFQVMFSLQSGQAAATRRPHSELRIKPIEAHSGTSKFDLTLFMVEEEETISGALEFNTDLFKMSTIDRMIAHFKNILRDLTANPDKPISFLSMISADEKQKILDECRGSEPARKLTKNIIEIFEDAVHANPEHCALRLNNFTLTYSEMNQRINRLAHHLIDLGVKPEKRVGICLDRSPDLIISLLAILKAGGAYVPIDPNYPAERLAFILDDSGINVLLTASDLNKIIPEQQAVKVNLDQEAARIDGYPDGNPQITVFPENPAYMIYTSGSTGLPKGTVITHHGLTNYLNWCLETYPLDAGQGSLVHSTVAFDATVTSLFTPILTGKTITLLPGDADLEALSKILMATNDFSVLKITPAHLDLISHQIPPTEAASITHAFVIGGENLTAGQIEFWQKNAPNTFLYNEYGPTENVVGCIVYEALHWKGTGSVPIGKAIHNTYAYILDENLEIVPAGLPGELYLGGESLARGYHHRTDLTADRFIPDPFSEKPGARIYKTGDLVRFLPDGDMEFLGRVDSQVKLRGYRIELSEIEFNLAAFPGIDDAVVIVREDQPGDKRLTAYFTTEKKIGLKTADIKKHLTQLLPEYMVPVHFIELESFPLTPNGKVDRRALPKPEYNRDESAAKFIAPLTGDEVKMAKIWQEILNIELIGTRDNFFELGGHSLLATQLISRIRDVFDVELPLHYLFESPTIAGLNIHLNQEKAQKTGTKKPELVQAGRKQRLPLSFTQQRLWFLDQLTPENPFYNIPAAIRIKGAFDLEIFEKVINEIIRRQESLRTVFESEYGQPFQVIRAYAYFSLPVTDLTQIPSGTREAEIERLLKADAGKPFNLSEGPLFRAGIIKIAKDESIICFTMHHIISDGWSTNVLLAEISALYDAFKAGRKSAVPDLKIQYADYAVWQRSWFDDETLETELQFWKNYLGSHPPVLNLPTDFSRPPVQTFSGTTLNFRLDKKLSDDLRVLGQKENCTVFMTLFAAFQSFLHRYTGQDEIYTGTPIANRTQSETEDLIGFFANTLVLKNDFPEQINFVSLLKNTRQNALNAFVHQEMPFEKLVDTLQPERDPSHSPLFQVMFIMQNTQSQNIRVRLPGLEMEVLDSESGTAKFDLSLMVLDDENGFQCEWEYNTDLFRESTIDRMTGHFKSLLENIVVHPNYPISALPLIRDEEKKRIGEQWNNTSIPLPAQQLIHRLFEDRVRKTPEAPAVRFKSRTLSFNELNERANRLAHFLIDSGVGAEKFIGISVERSIEMVVGLLGILKAGGVYVPIDPSYPAERIQFILQDAGIEILLSQESLAPVFGNFEGRIIKLDTDDLFASCPETDPQPELYPDQLAYMIYTSGSTGLPKGTMLQHRGLCNLTLAQIRDFQLFEGARCLQFASFSFDASVSEIFTTLISGATLYLADREQLMPGPDLNRLLKDNAITTVTLPPSVTTQLNPADFPELKTLVSAGEACPKDIANRWFGKVHFLNAYGPTENTVCACSHSVTEPVSDAVVPIGKPIENVQLYILDTHLNIQPVGVPGELHIAGAGLARGYYHRPDLTAEKYFPNPFSEAPGSRLYKSGDLARWLPDGKIEFLGRIDEQVKIRGFRIELGEIEHALLKYPAIENCTVIPREDVPGDVRLAAYYVCKSGQKADRDEIKSQLKKSLPDYMMPSAFVQLEAIPLTPNGKVNRRLLPKPEMTRLDVSAPFAAARTHSEKQLADIWRGLLGVEKIGIHDNFFELGGHSLLATQLISRIRDQFRLDLPLMALFEQPTVAGLAIKLEEVEHQAKGLTNVSIEKADRSEPLPLSFAQQRLWFLDQLSPNSPAYNIPTILRIKGRLDLKAFELSLAALIRRHESLRTTFSSVNGSPVQVITESLLTEIEVADISDFDPVHRDEEMHNRVYEDLTEPFDLEVGPLFRAKIIRLGNHEQVVIFNMHHIISDGWSMGILISEFSVLYESFSTNGSEAALTPLKIQYADFAAWQRQWLKDEILQKQVRYWQNQIGKNPEPLNLPVDFARPAVQTFNGGSYDTTLEQAVYQKLKALSSAHGATLFMTLTAAFQLFLRLYTRQDEILIGTPIANRTRSELEHIIGFFVNNLVIKADFSSVSTFGELLDQIKSVTLEAYTNQDLPFEQLVEIIQPERDMSHAPVFQVAFVMQNTPMGKMALSDIQIEPVDADQKIAKYDLTLIMMESDDGLFAEFEYNTDLFKASTIKRMMDQFTILLGRLTDRPDQGLNQINLLNDREYDLVIRSWNKTERAFDDQSGIHQLFERIAAKYPKKYALSFGGQKLTYSELNRKANQFAHYLIEAGVQREEIIGIALDKSFDMIISILAILKSGAAYLPIDPGYPAERIRYMIGDSGITKLICDENAASELYSDKIERIDPQRIATNLQSKSVLNPDLPIDPAQLAYIIYTSGSTGRPKGTMLQHRGLCNLAESLREIYQVTPGSRNLQFAAFGFDASVEEIFTPLTTGAMLVLVERDTLLSGTGLVRILKKEKITNVTLPPSVLSILKPEDFPDLKSVVSAGEACTPAIANAWSRGRNFINGYGPTENTVCSTTYAVEAHIAGRTVPIGKPNPNARAYILDPALNPLPVGITGELCLAGVGLARGYLNRPDLTAEKFIPDPFSGVAGSRLYRTGDLARFLEDGNMEFFGRMDAQVKLRGFRVELGEIESALRDYQGIDHAVVSTFPSPNNDPVLAAYIIGNTNQSPDKAGIQKFLKARLPEYMVPNIFIPIDAIPLTPNGKVDYRALPVPDLSGTAGLQKIVKPRNSAEARLQEIWEKVLQVSDISVTASFFDLGGHSLLAMKLLTEIENQLGKDVNLVNFFREPTIEHLAIMITEETTQKSTMQLIRLKKGSDDQPIFFIHPSGGGVHHYSELAQMLDTDRAFYAIQAKGLNGKEELHKSIEEMAAAYIDLITTKQPEGSYILGSWSMGVMIVHEMAVQLNRMGRTVAGLIQLDQGPEITYEKPADTAEMLYNMFKRYFRLDINEMRRMDEEAQFRFAIKKAKKHKVIPKFIRLADFKRYIIVNETQIQAWVDYETKYYDGEMLLFRSAENVNPDNPNLGWDKFAKKIRTIDVPGDHISMMQKPDVETLAGKFKDVLNL